MAYNTKNLITDAGTKQIPQFFDTAADNYYALLGTDGLGPFYVSRGAAAHGAAASGNPVQMGGVYRVANPALDDGDAGSLRVNVRGEAIVDGEVEVTGTAAHDAAASGNPVQIGGVYRTADPALANGDVGSLRVNAAGELITETQLTGSNAAVHESLTVDATVGGKAFANYATNIYSFITAETAQMRFTVDGTAPTTTVGHLLNPGDILELDSLADITAFRAIRTGSVSGVLKATYSGVA